MSYQKFLMEYGIPIPPREFAIVMDAIPTGVVMLLRSTAGVRPTLLPLDPTESAVGGVCFSPGTRNNNCGIRSLFQNDIVSVPYVVAYWNNCVSDLNWKKIWTLPSTLLITNKMKEVSFKIIHRYYPSKLFLQRFKLDIDVNCSFCNMYPEDVTHLFWNCSHSNHLWKDICTFITRFIDPKFSLCIEHVLFGFFNYTSSQANQYFIINLIILLAKWHIHKCKY